MNPIEYAHRHKFQIFGQPATEPLAQGKQQLKSLENDVNLFSILYVARQNTTGNVDKTFLHY